MDNLWSDEDAEKLVRHYVGRGVHPDLALRTYSSRLLGSVASLVMHGGGNTSVKITQVDLFNEPVQVICVKGSGRDLGTIEPDGHPAVRMAPLGRYRGLAALSDEDMVNAQRQNLLDTMAPNPSVETLLHAYLPHIFIDHTHSVTSTAIAALPNVEAVCREIYGNRVRVVPYIMPGFSLAKLAAEIYDASPDIEGLILAKHGIFTFADTARRAYDLMIEMVSLAERYIAEHGSVAPAFDPIDLPKELLPIADALPVLRGLLASAAAGRAPSRWVLSVRSSERIRRFVDGRGVADYACRGVATPEQVIRIKSRPCILPAPDASDPSAWKEAATAAISQFVSDYDAYFQRQNARVGGNRKQLDPLPRLFLFPGVGIIGVGASSAAAEISSDIGEAWIDAVVDAESLGSFESISEDDHFDVEYWSLEQAKLNKSAEARLARHVVLVTGGAGAIGEATARAFSSAGAEVAILDLDEGAAAAAAARVGKRVLAVGCDLNNPEAVRRAFDNVTTHFGGLDIVVSNAGSAQNGMMAELPAEILRASFELNFFAHQSVAQNAVSIMQAQGFGGVLLFNASKQAVNPGEAFGAYGTPKAALLSLMRQYALEHGKDGIRANAVNADRIRSGLLSDEMISKRAAARSLSEQSYMRGNLLQVEVRADDVAEAFLASALLQRTTGNVMTVDGGNVAAMMR